MASKNARHKGKRLQQGTSTEHRAVAANPIVQGEVSTKETSLAPQNNTHLSARPIDQFMAIVSVLTLLVLVVYTILVGLQLREMQGATKAAFDAIEQNGRAWVTIKTVQTNSLDRWGGSATLVFQNTGHSPASGTADVWVRIYPSGEALPSFKELDAVSRPPDDRATPGSRFVMAPGESTGEGQIAFPIFRYPDLGDLRNEKSSLYIFGILNYEDGFKHKRQTGFCYRMEPPDGRGWAQCQSNNYAN